MKVLFLTNIPSPYRVDFFNELGKYCELTVAFEGENATDRDKKWKASEVQNFKAIFLRGVRTKSDQFLCLDIFKVIKEGFDRIIVGGYSTPTGMLAIEFMRLHRIPFWIEADGGMISQDNWIKYRIKKHFISAACGWLSSGKMTTKYFVDYGADVSRICTYPFTSLKTEEYQRIKEELELNNVYFVGFKTKDQLKQYYKAADLFVLPTREDIWGLVVNEAMAYMSAYFIVGLLLTKKKNRYSAIDV